MYSALDEFGETAIGISSRFIVRPRFDAMREMRNLIKIGFQYCRDNEFRVLYGDCGLDLIGFYRRLGYRPYTKPFHDESFGLKYPIILVGRDKEFLQQVNSPLAPLIAPLEDDDTARKWFARNWEKGEAEVMKEYESRLQCQSLMSPTKAAEVGQ